MKPDRPLWHGQTRSTNKAQRYLIPLERRKGGAVKSPKHQPIMPSNISRAIVSVSSAATQNS